MSNKSNNITNIIEQAAEMGDTLVDTFNQDYSIKTANAASTAYRTAIQASKVKLTYFKGVKNGEIPNKIPFFED